MKRVILWMAAGSLALLLWPAMPPVQAQPAPEPRMTVVGEASCDEMTGARIITWTATNTTSVPTSILNVELVSAPTELPPTVETTPFVPDPVPASGGTATATSRLPGTWVGNVGMLFDVLPPAVTMGSSVSMFQPCLPPLDPPAPTTTATTTTAPSTSSTSVAARATRARPTFTG